MGSRPVPNAGKAAVALGRNGRVAPERPTGVGVQAPREGFAEITSGRAITQQGLAATCKDPLTDAEAEGSGRLLPPRASVGASDGLSFIPVEDGGDAVGLVPQAQGGALWYVEEDVFYFIALGTTQSSRPTKQVGRSGSSFSPTYRDGLRRTNSTPPPTSGPGIKERTARSTHRSARGQNRA